MNGRSDWSEQAQEAGPQGTRRATGQPVGLPAPDKQANSLVQGAHAKTGTRRRLLVVLFPR